MIQDYLVLEDRIRLELAELDQVVGRADRAAAAASAGDEHADLFVDAAALNLHDYYAGVERIFQQIAAIVDGNVPSGPDWRRKLLSQMQGPFADIRPAVLSAESGQALDEYLRFRHVVRNIYAFQFDPRQISRLATELISTAASVREELVRYAAFLAEVGR